MAAGSGSIYISFQAECSVAINVLDGRGISKGQPVRPKSDNRLSFVFFIENPCTKKAATADVKDVGKVG